MTKKCRPHTLRGHREDIIIALSFAGATDGDIEKIMRVIDKYIETSVKQERNLNRCHVCINLGYDLRYCYYCGREANTDT